MIGPRQQVKHRKLAQKRINIKTTYEKDRETEGIDKNELLGDFLSAMGHNVVSSTLVGRMNDRTLSENPHNIIEEGDSHNDISSWQILDEQPEIEIMEGENPYQGRRVGVSR